MEKKELKKEFYSVKEIAEYLGFSAKHVYNLIHEGKIPHYDLAGSLKFKVSEIERWAKEQQKSA